MIERHLRCDPEDRFIEAFDRYTGWVPDRPR
jgi:hypothetical protein